MLIFAFLFFLESPFQQLFAALGSSLFWFMLLFFVIIGAAAFRFYVRSDNDMSEEELYFISQLSRQELSFVSAEKQEDRGPFEPNIIENGITPLRQSFWKVKAQNKQENVIEFWARVDYRNTSLLDIKWIPNIRKLEGSDV